MLILHYYLKPQVKKINGMLDVARSDFWKIDLSFLANSKRASLWVSYIYYLASLDIGDSQLQDKGKDI